MTTQNDHESDEQPAVTVISETIEEKTGKVVNSFPAAPVKADTVPSGVELNFDMYCVVKGIPPHHRPGMRAFNSTSTASVSKWDEIFKNY